MSTEGIFFERREKLLRYVAALVQEPLVLFLQERRGKEGEGSGFAILTAAVGSPHRLDWYFFLERFDGFPGRWSPDSGIETRADWEALTNQLEDFIARLNEAARTVEFPDEHHPLRPLFEEEEPVATWILWETTQDGRGWFTSPYQDKGLIRPIPIAPAAEVEFFHSRLEQLRYKRILLTKLERFGRVQERLAAMQNESSRLSTEIDELAVKAGVSRSELEKLKAEA